MNASIGSGSLGETDAENTRDGRLKPSDDVLPGIVAALAPLEGGITPSDPACIITFPESITALCQRVANDLRELATVGFSFGVSERAFTTAVLRIEADELRPRGVTLTASNTFDDWTVVRLRSGDGEESAVFEFLPSTGAFRESGSGPKSRPRLVSGG